VHHTFGSMARFGQSVFAAGRPTLQTGLGADSLTLAIPREPLQHLLPAMPATLLPGAPGLLGATQMYTYLPHPP